MLAEWGIKSIAVADYDADFVRFYEQAAEKFEIKRFYGFTTSKEFLDCLKSKKIDLIIMEWKIDILPGYALIQIIRNEPKWQHIPILVISSLLNSQDVMLLSELGVDYFLDKPVSTPQLQGKLLEIAKTCEDNKKTTKLRQDFEKHMSKNNLLKADLITSELLEIDPKSNRNLTLLARLLMAQGHYNACINICMKILSINRRFTPAYSVLGKVYGLQNDFKKSVKYFEKAQLLSPKNMNRLLDLGEVKLNAGEVDKAKEYISQVFNTYPNFKGAKEKMLKACVAQGDLQLSRELFSESDSALEVGAYLNNHGVSLIKIGKHKDGIKYYQNAAKVLSRSEVLHKLFYNISLAYFRQGQLIKAQEYIRKSSRLDPTYIKSKALKRKVHDVLNPPPPPITEKQEDEKIYFVIKVPKSSTLGLFMFNDVIRNIVGPPLFEIKTKVITQEQWEEFGQPLYCSAKDGSVEITIDTGKKEMEEETEVA